MVFIRVLLRPKNVNFIQPARVRVSVTTRECDLCKLIVFVVLLRLKSVNFSWLLQTHVSLMFTYVNYFPRDRSLSCLPGVKAWISLNSYKHTWAWSFEDASFGVSASAGTGGSFKQLAWSELKTNWRLNIDFQTRSGKACFVCLIFNFSLILNANFSTNCLVAHA